MRSNSVESFGASALSAGGAWCRIAFVSFGTNESLNGNRCVASSNNTTPAE